MKPKEPRLRKGSRSFKESFDELERIADAFESGVVDLEEGLPKFERALELAEFCQQRLGIIEHRIVDLKRKFASLLTQEGNAQEDDTSEENS